MPVIRDVPLSIGLANAPHFESTFVQTGYLGRYRITDGRNWQDEEVAGCVKTPSA